MANQKTYWDKIKKETCYISGGNEGWEVRYTYDDYFKKMVLEFPFRTGDGIPSSEKSLCRKQVKLKLKIRKLLAQASTNQTEFRDLNTRIYNVNPEEIINLKLTGFDLRNYIQRQYLTDSEAYSLFYRM